MGANKKVFIKRKNQSKKLNDNLKKLDDNSNDLDDNPPPYHVGIIMDGNGRWAKLRNKQRDYGHKAGAKVIKEVVSEFYKKGVTIVSLYAFSTENMQRPKDEVDKLFDILSENLKKYGEICFKNKVKLVVSGDISPLPEKLKAAVRNECEKTSAFNSHILNICLNYGAKQDICNALSSLKNSGEEITIENIENNLYNKIPALDLVIRSGGEQRLSNFMLWQAAYAELYFTDVLWPDFNKEQADKALDWFNKRKRRFGKL